ncbi:hypothetical protein SLE2022_330800 [Rubroshorea leprosula]
MLYEANPHLEEASLLVQEKVSNPQKIKRKIVNKTASHVEVKASKVNRAASHVGLVVQQIKSQMSNYNSRPASKLIKTSMIPAAKMINKTSLMILSRVHFLKVKACKRFGEMMQESFRE